MSRILSIGTAVPEFGTDQRTILQFMKRAYNNDVASRKLDFLFHQSGISKRHSVLPDFGNGQSEYSFFKANQSPPNVEERMKEFKKGALALSLEAIQDSLRNLATTTARFGITHLITVTCTGISAPGIDTEIIDRLKLPNDIFHTSVNFIGCNAAFHALKIADMIVQNDRDAKVLIVCVELCTLHFQPKTSSDNLLSNTIFGDGSAAVLVTSDFYADEHRHGGLTMDGFYSLLLRKGMNLMGWNVTAINFEMLLDARIPELIGEEVDEIVRKAGKKYNIGVESIGKWAVHPGGKRILDGIRKRLYLKDSDLQFSYEVLDRYGNMSSPTILFVLKAIMKSNLRPGEKVFSIGFGPGLSVETALFTNAV